MKNEIIQNIRSAQLLVSELLRQKELILSVYEQELDTIQENELLGEDSSVFQKYYTEKLQPMEDVVEKIRRLSDNIDEALDDAISL